MPLESDVNYLSDLNSGYPVDEDHRHLGDDHLRNIKKALKQSFPNVNGACNPTAAEFNLLASVGVSDTLLSVDSTGIEAVPIRLAQQEIPYTLEGGTRVYALSLVPYTLHFVSSTSLLSRVDLDLGPTFGFYSELIIKNTQTVAAPITYTSSATLTYIPSVATATLMQPGYNKVKFIYFAAGQVAVLMQTSQAGF